MRHVTLAAVTAAATAACTIPEKQQFPPFGCNGQLLPDRPKQQVITIRGSVVFPSLQSLPLSDALIQIYLDGKPIGSVKSQQDGSFVIPQSTDGKPMGLSLKVSHPPLDPENPLLDTYFFPSAPLTEDLDDVQIEMLTPVLATAIMMRAGVALDLQKILMAITVVDCNDEVQGGAKVSTTPSGAEVHYLVEGAEGIPVPDASVKVTDPGVGTGFAVNIPVPASPTDPITIHATMPLPTQISTILTLRDNPIMGAKPGVLIQAEIQP